MVERFFPKIVSKPEGAPSVGILSERNAPGNLRNDTEVCYKQGKTAYQFGERPAVPRYDKIPTYLNPEQRLALTQIPPDLGDS
jgi:hypothetical protein